MSLIAYPQLKALFSHLGHHLQHIDTEPEILQKLILHPEEASRAFLAWAKDFRPTEEETPPRALLVDRAQPFNAEQFLGSGWKVLSEDKRALKLTELNALDIVIDMPAREGEWSRRLEGKKRIARLDAKARIKLDASVAIALMSMPENQLPEIFWQDGLYSFDGTIVTSPHGVQHTLCIQGGYSRQIFPLDFSGGYLNYAGSACLGENARASS